MDYFRQVLFFTENLEPSIHLAAITATGTRAVDHHSPARSSIPVNFAPTRTCT